METNTHLFHPLPFPAPLPHRLEKFSRLAASSLREGRGFPGRFSYPFAFSPGV